jgi:hypothetical protein
MVAAEEFEPRVQSTVWNDGCFGGLSKVGKNHILRREAELVVFVPIVATAVSLSFCSMSRILLYPQRLGTKTLNRTVHRKVYHRLDER